MNRLLVLLLSCLFIFAGFSHVTANEDEERAKEFEDLRVDVDRLLEEVYKNGEEEGEGEDTRITVKGADKVRMSGEIRIRQNWWNNYYVPMSMSNPDGFISENFAHMRTRLRFDFDVVEDVAAVVELQDVRVLGNPVFNVGIGNATTQVNSGFVSPVSGVAALPVLTTSIPPSVVWTSQAHPEPKVVTAVLVNSSLNTSKSPNFDSMAAATAPLGAPPPPLTMPPK